MSLLPGPWAEVPEMTARVARSAFPKGCLAMRVRDELGAVFGDVQFAAVFGARGRPGWSPGRLALVSVLQFAENLTDRQAADQVRGRIDWKYALGLELDDAGFDHSVLTGFRARLVEHGWERKILDLMLARLAQVGLVKAGGRARTDSTHVLAAVRTLNRIEFVGETLRAALEALAAADPGWLAAHIRPEWAKRYGARVDSYRMPKGEAARAELAITIGQDGFGLLEAVFSPGAPAWLREVPAVEILRTAWIQQYHRTITGTGAQVAWRESKDLPPGRMRLASPYDSDARYGVKRGSGWIGYKVHLTETCDDVEVSGTPHVITNVETTDATVTDQDITAVVHDRLAGRGLLPGEHAVDAGYASAELILTAAAEHSIELIGPVGADTTWQTKDPDAFDLSHFSIDWGTKQVTCPGGATSSSWRTEKARGKPVLKVDFRKADCTPCPLRARCTSSKTNARKLTLRHREQHQALEHARAEQATDTWKHRYAIRAGVEGTIHQAVTLGARRSRYHGLAKTHLAHTLTATAINLIRLDAWWTGTPLGHTRHSHLSTLDFALAG
ncbi:IS1182 family transposase [Nocardia vinacea]|uniref:IS1182 family transposase n=1 Tax=Nocardia vinacea TaxID=96468 RepID=UPI003F4DA56B